MTAKRKTLDRIGPPKGARLRVFFPYDAPPKVFVASGETRLPEAGRGKFDHRLVDPDAPSSPEWLPGWYIAEPAGRAV